jgi:hypothetical protein
VTTYLLPSALGGTKRKAHHERSQPGAPAAGFYIDGEVVWIPLTLLTEVAQPLPEEPPDDSIVRVGDEVYWRQAGPFHDESLRWLEFGPDAAWRSWAEVCARGTPVRLVPDLAEPVEIPWHGEESDNAAITVDRYDEGNVSILLHGRATAWVPLDTAREMARALLTAAARQSNAD